AEGESHILRDSGLFPLCARGDVNLYAVFAEAMRQHLAAPGRMGAVLPSGIATDDTTKFFFQELVKTNSLVSFFDFQSGGLLFGDIGHARFKFCLFTSARQQSSGSMGFDCCFFLREIEHLSDADRRFVLTREDVALLNPNTLTCPIFRT